MGKSWQRIIEIFIKELRLTLREPRMRFILFGPPIVQLVIFGYAVNLDVQNSPLAILDQDRTPESRQLLAEFEGTPNFHAAYQLDQDDAIQELLDRGQVHSVVRVLPGFGREVQRGQSPKIQILIDGTNSNTASIVSNNAGQVIARYANRIQPQAPDPPVSVESRVWFNEDLKSQNYFVPGVVVNILALVTVMLTAMAIVREKEIGTMEQLMVTPLRPIELILGKTLPFALIGLLDLCLVTGAALLIFGIPFRGNPLLLLACGVLFLLTTLGMGLLFSTVSENQQQAMMGGFFFFLPAFMLSGFAFPIRNMPIVVQYLTYLNPVRYFMTIVRGIFLKGTGLDVLWPQMLALAILGTMVITFSTLHFSKRLE